MVGAAFGFLFTLVSLGAVVLMLVLIIQGQNRSEKRRQETFFKVLDSGVYDYRLLGKPKRGHAMLGWGIVFVAIGLGVLIGLASMSDPIPLREGGVTGSMIPMLVGVGMIIFYFLSRKLSDGKNGEPVVFDREDGKVPPRIAGHGASDESD